MSLWDQVIARTGLSWACRGQQEERRRHYHHHHHHIQNRRNIVRLPIGCRATPPPTQRLISKCWNTLKIRVKETSCCLRLMFGFKGAQTSWLTAEVCVGGNSILWLLLTITTAQPDSTWCHYSYRDIQRENNKNTEIKDQQEERQVWEMESTVLSQWDLMYFWFMKFFSVYFSKTLY